MIVKVNNLFGRFDYVIETTNDGVTIITGPNGFGKSTILRMLSYLSVGFEGMMKLVRIPFLKLEIEGLRSGVAVEKNPEHMILNGAKVKLSDLNEAIKRYVLRSRYVFVVDEQHVLDKRTDIIYTMDDYLEKVLADESTISYADYPFEKSSETIKNFLKKTKEVSELLGSVFFIEEQRLIKKAPESGRHYSNETRFINAIEELPKKMSDIFARFTAEYSSFAAGLDSTFPNRLIEERNSLDKETYQRKMDDFVAKYNLMKKYELANIDFKAFTFDEEYSKVLKVYFDDFQSKYSIYEGLIEKLDAFTEIVNSHLTFKKMLVSKQFGVRIQQEDGEELSLASLSSGEKQEIVMFFSLIFETPKQSLLLVDEPEISLHVAWQKKFINDLEKIMTLNGCSAVIATHSPQIIDSHWDITTDLGELYELSSKRNY